MSYYLAPSLDVLRGEINTRWPGRDKGSDGWIGDAAHQASKSDHNPNSRGSVNAIDVDKDGVDMWEIIAAFERHPSAHYWIYRGLIADADQNWRRRLYTGSNRHDKHGHLSIRQSRAAEQDRRPWGLLEDEMSEAEIIAALRKAITTDPVIKRELSRLPWAFAPAEHAGKKTAHALVLQDLPRLVATVRSELAEQAGRDVVDEQQVAAGLAPALLAVLTPQAIAAAIPTDIAGQVADELAGRLGQARE
ncbi:hypothetical protein [Micromonospora sp. NPDC047730]|uniref:hypothetical protein n=1 Tax=Micromonospora sp. NPDC047730 TaxID=3364253 RepID=UPI0037152532